MDMFDPDPALQAAEKPEVQAFYQQLLDAGLDPSVTIHDALDAFRPAELRWRQATRRMKEEYGGDKAAFIAAYINAMVARHSGAHRTIPGRPGEYEEF